MYIFKPINSIFSLITFVLIANMAWAQPNNKAENAIPDIRKGNKLFTSQKYAEAEIAYRKALEKDPNNKEATYNLGTAQYQQKKFEDAIASFQKSAENYSKPSEGVDFKQMRAASYHNLGNAHLLKQDADKAIEAYKNALKLNPSDMDTKYNLVLAMQEKKKQDQQNKDKKDNKKGDQDKKDKGDKGDDQNKDGQGNKDDKKDGDKKEGDGKNGDEKGKEEQTRPGQMSKEQAEKLLEALQNQEQKTQEKMQRIKGKPTPVKVEKDW